MKRLVRTLDLVVTLVAVLGTAAKIRKDIRTHRTHGEHDPCACSDQCLVCLR
jgi:hypothetical protein